MVQRRRLGAGRAHSARQGTSAPSAVAGAVAIPASQWIQKAPQTIPIIKEKIAVLRQPIDYLQEGLRELEGAAIATHQETAPHELPAPRAYSPVFGNLAGDTAIV